MRFLKKLATICMALMMCLGFGVVFTACDDENGSNSQQSYAATYTFSVTKNSAPAVGYEIQLCVKNADGTLGTCLMPVAVGADGVAKVGVSDASCTYEIHVTKGNVPLEKTKYVIMGVTDIPANYSGGTISVIVND